MSNRAVISTPAAPNAIGPYSQAIKVGNTVWISGQIALHPETNEMLLGDIESETRQAFQNVAAIASAAGGSRTSDSRGDRSATTPTPTSTSTSAPTTIVPHEISARFIVETGDWRGCPSIVPVMDGGKRFECKHILGHSLGHFISHNHNRFFVVSIHC